MYVTCQLRTGIKGIRLSNIQNMLKLMLNIWWNFKFTFVVGVVLRATKKVITTNYVVYKFDI